MLVGGFISESCSGGKGTSISVSSVAEGPRCRAKHVYQALYRNSWENRLLHGFLYADQLVGMVEPSLTTRRRGYILASYHIYHI